MSKRLSVTLTCPPSPSRLRKFHPGFVDDINIANIANAFQKSTPCSNRSQISKLSDIYMFGCADGRCLCSEDLRTFCGRVCFPLSATIIIQYISEKACCSPHRQMYNWPSLSEWRRCILGQRRRRTTTRTAARQKYRKGKTLTFCPTSSPGVNH